MKRGIGVIRTFHAHLFLIFELITLDWADKQVKKHKEPLEIFYCTLQNRAIQSTYTAHSSSSSFFSMVCQEAHFALSLDHSCKEEVLKPM